MSTTWKWVCSAALTAIAIGLVSTAVASGGPPKDKGKPPAEPPPIPPLRYTLRLLDTLGGENTHASGLNHHGDVVGYSGLAVPDGVGLGQHPFVYNFATDTIHDLHEFIDPGILWDGSPTETGWVFMSADDINDSGQIAGSGYYVMEGQIGHSIVYRFTPPGPGEQFGTIDNVGSLGGDTHGDNIFINDFGDVAGSSIANGEWHAFLWMAPGPIVDLGTLDGVPVLVEGFNNLCQLVGYGSTAAWRYTPGVGIVDLGSLYQDRKTGAYGTARAEDINNFGQVVGYTHINAKGSNRDGRAFLYTDGLGMRDLGTLGERRDADDSEATAVNDFEYVVGFSDTEAGLVSFLWHNDFGMAHLDDLIDDVPAGFQVGPLKINNANLILASTASPRDCLLIPYATE